MCVYPFLSDEGLPGVFGAPKNANGSVQKACRETARFVPYHTNSRPQGARDALANVRCYSNLAEEVIVKVLSNIVARLSNRLIWAVVEAVANSSLDTVNTIP